MQFKTVYISQLTSYAQSPGKYLYTLTHILLNIVRNAIWNKNAALNHMNENTKTYNIRHNT
jgi:hypothetical protein